MQLTTDYTFIRNVGELTDDGVCVYHLDLHRFVYVNQHFLDFFRLSRDHVLSDASVLLKIIAAEDLEYLHARFAELLEKRCINTTEFRLQFSEQEITHLSCDVLVLDDQSLVTAFVKDVSMAKRHEDYLIKYTAQKDILLDMLTHNLSGPLQLSKDLIASLQTAYGPSNLEVSARLLSIVEENTQQCIDIVNDFLHEEHFESLRTYVRKTRFDIVEKIEVVVDKMRTMNKSKLFLVKTSAPNLNVNSDAVKFFQIVHNILSNAIKFTAPDGTIEIHIQDAPGMYTISIHDNGVGIPPAIRPLLFRERIKGTTGLKGERSSGLGLFIARKLVDLMHGEIRFESEPGAGTTFYIRLPKE